MEVGQLCLDLVTLRCWSSSRDCQMWKLAQSSQTGWTSHLCKQQPPLQSCLLVTNLWLSHGSTWIAAPSVILKSTFLFLKKSPWVLSALRGLKVVTKALEWGNYQNKGTAQDGSQGWYPYSGYALIQEPYQAYSTTRNAKQEETTGRNLMFCTTF